MLTCIVRTAMSSLGNTIKKFGVMGSLYLYVLGIEGKDRFGAFWYQII